MSRRIEWGMMAAALLVLGGCAEQATGPGHGTSSTMREPPVPSVPQLAKRPVPAVGPSCFAPGGPGRLVGDTQALESEECQQRFTTWLDARRTATSGGPVRYSALQDGVCSVTGHDVVVSTIEDLRVAVAGSAPGTVIGINGVLDINGDGGGDVVVTADGITLTCASDGAGLVGHPAVAVLNVPSSQVRIERLTITALPETGGADRSRSVWVEGDGGVLSHNQVECTRTCILFIGASGGTVDHNDLTSGSKAYAIGVANGRDIVVTNNTVVDCLTCIEFDDHSGGVVSDNHVTASGYGVVSAGSTDFSVTGNTIAECFWACVLALPSFAAPTSNLLIQGNHLYGCGDAGPDVWTEGCVFLQSLIGGFVQGNDIHGDPSAMAVRITPYDGNPADVVVRDNLAEGSLWAFFADRISFTGNTVSNCAGSCVLMYFAPDAEVRGNHITGSDVADVGVWGESSPGLSVVGNTVRGRFQGFDVWGIVLYENGPSLVSENDIAIEVDGFPAGGLRIRSMSNGRVEKNRIDIGPATPNSIGLLLSGLALLWKTVDDGQVIDEDRYSFLPVTGNLVAANHISGAGVGLLVDGACRNTFVGNNLARNEIGAVFTLAGLLDVFPDPGDPNVQYITEGGGTGANTLTGNGNAVTEATDQGLPVAGNGYLDCDGDGVRDPNSYSGTRVVRGGGAGTVIGQILSQLHKPAP